MVFHTGSSACHNFAGPPGLVFGASEMPMLVRRSLTTALTGRVEPILKEIRSGHGRCLMTNELGLQDFMAVGT